MSRAFRKEVDKQRPSVFLAYLAKQMQIRARVMHDATKLMEEKPSHHGLDSDKADFFSFTEDEE